MTLKKIEQQDLLKKMAEMGLGLDRNEKKDKPSPNLELLIKNYKMAQDFKKVFSTAAGERVLAYLMEQTLQKIAWHHSAQTMDQAMLYGLHRQGQDSVMMFILEAIALAEKGPPVKDQK